MCHLINWMNRGDLVIKSLQTRLITPQGTYFSKTGTETENCENKSMRDYCLVLSEIYYFLYTTALPSQSNRSHIHAELNSWA